MKTKTKVTTIVLVSLALIGTALVATPRFLEGRFSFFAHPISETSGLSISVPASAPKNNIVAPGNSLASAKWVVTASGEPVTITAIGFDLDSADRNMVGERTFSRGRLEIAGVGAVYDVDLIPEDDSHTDSACNFVTLPGPISIATGQSITINLFTDIDETARHGSLFRPILCVEASGRKTKQGNELTIVAPAIDVTKNAANRDSKARQGTTRVPLGSFNVTASGASDVTLKKIAVEFDAAAPARSLQKLYLYEGIAAIGEVASPSVRSGHTFEVNHLLRRGQSIKFSFVADIAQHVQGSFEVAVPENGVTAVSHRGDISLFAPLDSLKLQKIIIAP